MITVSTEGFVYTQFGKVCCPSCKSIIGESSFSLTHLHHEFTRIWRPPTDIFVTLFLCAELGFRFGEVAFGRPCTSWVSQVFATCFTVGNTAFTLTFIIWMRLNSVIVISLWSLLVTMCKQVSKGAWEDLSFKLQFQNSWAVFCTPSVNHCGIAILVSCLMLTTLGPIYFRGYRFRSAAGNNSSNW